MPRIKSQVSCRQVLALQAALPLRRREAPAEDVSGLPVLVAGRAALAGTRPVLRCLFSLFFGGVGVRNSAQEQKKRLPKSSVRTARSPAESDGKRLLNPGGALRVNSRFSFASRVSSATFEALRLPSPASVNSEDCCKRRCCNQRFWYELKESIEKMNTAGKITFELSETIPQSVGQTAKYFST